MEFADGKGAQNTGSVANTVHPDNSDDFMSIPEGIEDDLPFK